MSISSVAAASDFLKHLLPGEASLHHWRDVSLVLFPNALLRASVPFERSADRNELANERAKTQERLAQLSERRYIGVLLLTNYRMIFSVNLSKYPEFAGAVPSPLELDELEGFPEDDRTVLLSVPIGLVRRFKAESPKTVRMETFDLRAFRLSFKLASATSSYKYAKLPSAKDHCALFVTSLSTLMFSTPVKRSFATAFFNAQCKPHEEGLDDDVIAIYIDPEAKVDDRRGSLVLHPPRAQQAQVSVDDAKHPQRALSQGGAVSQRDFIQIEYSRQGIFDTHQLHRVFSSPSNGGAWADSANSKVSQWETYSVAQHLRDNPSEITRQMQRLLNNPEVQRELQRRRNIENEDNEFLTPIPLAPALPALPPLRISNLNMGYTFSPNCPELIAVPSAVGDDLLLQAGSIRANCMPVVTWAGAVDDALNKWTFLCRAASRTVDAKTNLGGVGADEWLLHSIREASANRTKLVIVSSEKPNKSASAPPQPREKILQQSRASQVSPSASAEAIAETVNSPDGENMVEHVFLGLPSLQKVSKSFLKMESLLKSESARNVESEVKQTRWLEYLSQLLSGAHAIVDVLTNECCSVIVECANGVDRTPQLTSLALLMIDPYYRTLAGFQVLIQKEWLWFSHHFSRRCGTPRMGNCGSLICSTDRIPLQRWEAAGRKADEMAPGSSSVVAVRAPPAKDEGIKVDARAAQRLPRKHDKKALCPLFLQFLDAVHQLLLQSPQAFEFNEQCLLFIAHHTHSRHFGTFFCDTAKEREEARLSQCTFSIWPAMQARRELFLNVQYVPLQEKSRPPPLRPVVGAAMVPQLSSPVSSTLPPSPTTSHSAVSSDLSTPRDCFPAHPSPHPKLCPEHVLTSVTEEKSLQVWTHFFTHAFHRPVSTLFPQPGLPAQPQSVRSAPPFVDTAGASGRNESKGEDLLTNAKVPFIATTEVPNTSWTTRVESRPRTAPSNKRLSLREEVIKSRAAEIMPEELTPREPRVLSVREASPITPTLATSAMYASVPVSVSAPSLISGATSVDLPPPPRANGSKAFSAQQMAFQQQLALKLSQPRQSPTTPAATQEAQTSPNNPIEAESTSAELRVQLKPRAKKPESKPRVKTTPRFNSAAVDSPSASPTVSPRVMTAAAPKPSATNREISDAKTTTLTTPYAVTASTSSLRAAASALSVHPPPMRPSTAVASPAMTPPPPAPRPQSATHSFASVGRAISLDTAERKPTTYTDLHRRQLMLANQAQIAQEEKANSLPLTSLTAPSPFKSAAKLILRDTPPTYVSSVSSAPYPLSTSGTTTSSLAPSRVASAPMSSLRDVPLMIHRSRSDPTASPVDHRPLSPPTPPPPPPPPSKTTSSASSLSLLSPRSHYIQQKASQTPPAPPSPKPIKPSSLRKKASADGVSSRSATPRTGSAEVLLYDPPRALGPAPPSRPPAQISDMLVSAAAFYGPPPSTPDRSSSAYNSPRPLSASPSTPSHLLSMNEKELHRHIDRITKEPEGSRPVDWAAQAGAALGVLALKQSQRDAISTPPSSISPSVPKLSSSSSSLSLGRRVDPDVTPSAARITTPR